MLSQQLFPVFLGPRPDCCRASYRKQKMVPNKTEMYREHVSDKYRGRPPASVGHGKSGPLVSAQMDILTAFGVVEDVGSINSLGPFFRSRVKKEATRKTLRSSSHLPLKNGTLRTHPANHMVYLVRRGDCHGGHARGTDPFENEEECDAVALR